MIDAEIGGDHLLVRLDLLGNVISDLAPVIKHDDAVREIHHYADVVLEYGRKIADGVPDVVKADQTVIDAYLGVGR